jgi:hypothetical protein
MYQPNVSLIFTNFNGEICNKMGFPSTDAGACALFPFYFFFAFVVIRMCG